MARQFATPIDMLLNEILNGKFQILAADPGAPVEGQFWYNSTDKVLKYRTDTTTIPLGTIDLSGYAPLASPNFTGDPTVPTPAAGDNDTSIANTSWVRARLAELVDSAPALLDTLNELAAALGDDPNFAATVTASLATKATKFTTTIGDGAARLYNVDHNLGNRWVNVQVFNATTGDLVEPDITLSTANRVIVNFVGGPVPTLNQYRVVVAG